MRPLSEAYRSKTSSGFTAAADLCYARIMRRGSIASVRPKLMTLEEWADLDDDIEGELVDGMLEEEEMPSVLHEIVVGWLFAVLRNWARPRGGFVVGSDTKVAVGVRRGRKPDLTLFLPGRMPALEDRLVRVAPHLVAEVTSPRPRDTHRDRVDKLADYARAGIRLYIIIDPQLRSVEVFELGRDRRYSVASAAGSGRIRVPACRGLVLNLDALWEEIDAAERAHARHRPRPAGRGRRHGS